MVNNTENNVYDLLNSFKNELTSILEQSKSQRLSPETIDDFFQNISSESYNNIITSTSQNFYDELCSSGEVIIEDCSFTINWGNEVELEDFTFNERVITTLFTKMAEELMTDMFLFFRTLAENNNTESTETETNNN